MAIDYGDERFAKVQAEKESTMDTVNTTYDSMINNTDSYYNDLRQATQDYEAKQTELQQARTDQTIKEINQNKEKTEQDYIKEQKAAYSDYAKQTDAYGVNAEKMAAAGLTGSGYSESSRVSMYNTYQNRIAVARESFNQAVLAYNDQIKQAELANSSALAEIAYNSLQTQLQLALEGFQYKNTLLTSKLNTGLQVDDSYYNRYRGVEEQINTENALAEQIRQFNEQMAYQRERDAVTDAQWQQSYNLSAKKASASGSGSKYYTSTFKDGNDGGDNNSNVEVGKMSENLIYIKINGKYYSFDTTNATKEDVIKWGSNLGVDLSSYF